MDRNRAMELPISYIDGFEGGRVVLEKNLNVTWRCSKDFENRWEISRLLHPLIGVKWFGATSTGNVRKYLRQVTGLSL